MSGALSNAFARAGTFCCAKRETAVNRTTAGKQNRTIRFMEAPLGNVKPLYQVSSHGLNGFNGCTSVKSVQSVAGNVTIPSSMAERDHLIMTAVGPDRVGLVETISEFISRHDC